MKKLLSVLLAFLMILAPMAVRAEQNEYIPSIIDPEDVTGVQVQIVCEVFSGIITVDYANFSSGYYPTEIWDGYDNAMAEAVAEADYEAAMAWIQENGEYVGTYYAESLLMDPNTGEDTYLIRSIFIYGSDGESPCIPVVADGVHLIRKIKLIDAQGNSTLLKNYESSVISTPNHDPNSFYDAYGEAASYVFDNLGLDDWLNTNVDFSDDLSDSTKKYNYFYDESENSADLDNNGIYVDTTTIFVTAKEEETVEAPTTPSYGIVADEESTTAVNTLSYTEGTEEGLTVVVKDMNAKEDLLTKDDLASVYVDGKLVDPSNYDVETGCIIVTLHKDFLDTLGKGDHTVTINLKDGGKSTAGFSVKAAETTEEGTVPEDGKKPEENTTPEDGKTEPVVPQPETTVPKSDSTGVGIEMLGYALVCAAGSVVTFTLGRKKRQ